MIYIQDINDYVGDFGSAAVVQFFQDKAEENDLVALQNFLENGMTVDLKDVIREIGSVEWSMAGDLNVTASSVIESLAKCKGGIAFLTF